MKTGIPKVLALCIACAIMLGACGVRSGISSAAGKSEGFKIVTSFYPVYIAAINVTKGIPGITVTNLTGPATGCLHDYNLRTGDMKNLEGADAFIINGAGMESFMEGIVEQQPNLKIIDASRGLALISDEGTGELNAHVWVSVSGAIGQVRNIAGQLSSLDPGHAKEYAENAGLYVKKLETLEKDMHRQLDGLGGRNIITFHEAFTYFAAEFGLNISAVMEVDPGSEPQAGELAALVDKVRRDNVRALFTEPQYPSDVADIISRETGAAVYELDPVVTGKADGDADAYIKRMEKNMNTLKEALEN